MSFVITVMSHSVADTHKLARHLLRQLPGRAVLALHGDLGSGKTCFVQGLAKGLGLTKKYYVNSPTFTILNVYEGGSLPLYHFDWYRLNSEAEVADLIAILRKVGEAFGK